MKVVYIVSYSKGGLPHYAAELANSIAKNRNIEIIVLKPTDLDENIFSENVRVINAFKPVYIGNDLIKMLENIIAFMSFKHVKLIDEIKPDIIHIHSSLLPLPIFLSLYKINKNYPLVITLHAVFSVFNFQFSALKDPLKFGTYLSELAVLSMVRSASKIIVHTLENRIEWIKRGIDPQKIVVIPHGAYSLFKKFDDGLQVREDSILFFGHIKENKGVEYLIRAIPLVWKDYPDIKLIIAGKEYDTRYKQYLNHSEYKNIEIINEFIPNELVPKLFKRAKVVVLPYTYHQGHSGVLTVAFSFGKPVVVTNVGSLPELVKNRREGFVVPPRNPKALADAIIKILEDDKLRKKMSKNALKKAEELSWSDIAKMHIRVYEKVIAERRG